MVEAHGAYDILMRCWWQGLFASRRSAERSLLSLQRYKHMCGAFGNTVAKQGIAAMDNAWVACSLNPI